MQFGHFGVGRGPGSLQVGHSSAELAGRRTRLSTRPAALRPVGPGPGPRPVRCRRRVRARGRLLMRVLWEQNRLVRSEMPDGPAIANLDQRVGHRPDEVPVVGHQQHGSGIGAEGVLENVAAGQVEMVGGLIQHQQVHRLHHQAGQGQTGALATGELRDPTVGVVSPQPERAEHGAQIAPSRIDPGREHLDRPLGAVQLVGLMLAEGGDTHVGAYPHSARTRGQLAQDQLQQGGLARAVGPHQGHRLAPLDRQGRAGDHRSVAVGVADGGFGEFGHHPAGAGRRREVEAGGQLGAAGDLDPVQLLEGLDPALHLAGLAGLVAEALDEALDAGYPAGLAGCGRLDALQAFGASHHELREPPVVGHRRARGQLHYPVRHRVDEVAVVAHEQKAARPCGQAPLQPRHGVDVQMVGGLVEQQDVGL